MMRIYNLSSVHLSFYIAAIYAEATAGFSALM